MSSSTLRDKNLACLSDGEFDVVVIGAGINGATSAAALASAGARVALIDKGDFGSGSSSNSSNFIWGGIKYLESREFSLVNKLCQSRNRLNRAYPAEVRETRFLATVQRGFRYPGLILFLGSCLYWAIGRFATRRPEYVSVSRAKAREPVINTAKASAALEYSDCYIVDTDARFVFGFVAKVLSLGGTAANHIEARAASYDKGIWDVTARDALRGGEYRIRARAVVNACGPAVSAFNEISFQTTQCRLAYSRGVHLVVRRLTKDERILVFFASDGRMFFIAPMGSRSCIGTTDTRIDTPSGEVTDADRSFILDNANEMLSLEKSLTAEDIISERCGVRPLVFGDNERSEDWLQMSRKHVVEVNAADNYISIFGGKLTDCLNVGEEVVAEVSAFGIKGMRVPDRWYGEPDEAAQQEFMRYIDESQFDSHTAASANEPLSERLWRRYGQYAMQIVDSIEAQPELARVIFPGSDYTAAELEFAAEHEMIATLDDLLRRRSDIAMVVPRQEIENSAQLAYINSRLFAADQSFNYADIQNG